MCFRNILLSKNFRLIGFLSHSAEKFRGEPFNVSENFGYPKISCIIGECHHFLPKIFSLTVPKGFVAEPFCVSENFWYGKNLWIRGGREYHVFSLELLVSESRKLQGEPFCVSDKFWYRKTLWITGRRGREGVSRFSVEKLLSHSTQKKLRVTLLCLKKILVSRNVTHKRKGASRLSVEYPLSNCTKTL